MATGPSPPRCTFPVTNLQYKSEPIRTSITPASVTPEQSASSKPDKLAYLVNVVAVGKVEHIVG